MHFFWISIACITHSVAVMNCTALAAELEAVDTVIAEQLRAGLSKKTATTALFVSWRTRLNNIANDIDADNMEAIKLAIDKGPWTTDQAKQLLPNWNGNWSTACRRKMQYMPNPENMFTAKELTKMKTSGVKSSIVSTISLRMWLNGIICPSEPLLDRLVRILAFVIGSAYDTSDHAAIKVDRAAIRSAIKSLGDERKGVTLPYITHYPSSSKDLAAEIYSYAYNSEDLVVDVHMPELETIFDENHKLRKAKTPLWFKHIPQQYHAGVLSQLNDSTSSPSYSLQFAESTPSTSLSTVGCSRSSLRQLGAYAPPLALGDAPADSPLRQHEPRPSSSASSLDNSPFWTNVHQIKLVAMETTGQI